MATVSFKNGVNSVDVASINGVHAHQPSGTRKVNSVNAVEWPRLSVNQSMIEFDYAGSPLGDNFISLLTNHPWTLYVDPAFLASASSGSGDDNIQIYCQGPNYGTEIYGEAIFYLDGMEYGNIQLVQWGF